MNLSLQRNDGGVTTRVKTRAWARDATDAFRVSGTCFSFFLFFLDYTNTFTVYYTYYSNNDSDDNDLDQGDEGWGLETPQLQLAYNENVRYR